MTDKQLWSAAKAAYIGARGGDWPTWEQLTEAERVAWRRAQGEEAPERVAPGQPCHAPGPWVLGDHFAKSPRYQTGPTEWCPACLGVGAKP